MFKNYIKIAFRNFIRHKGYSFITIFGLAVGLTVCILILLWVQFQLGMDRFHQDLGDIHLVLANGTVKNNPNTPAPLSPALKREVPEILEAGRYEGFPEVLFGHGNRRFYEDGVKAMDSSFFKIFSYPFSRGNPETALSDIRSVVITRRIAEKYFKGENPIGKTLTMNNRREFVVTGILKNIPSNSTFQFDIAIPYEIRILDNRERGWEMDWNSFSTRTFVKLDPNASAEQVNRKINDFLTRHNEKEDATLSLLSYANIHFFFFGTEKYIYIFSAIAILILLIACINFMNLSTSRSSSRAKEIGIRKVTGADSKSLVRLFLGESLLTSCIALLLALLLVELLLPVFNSLSGLDISFGSLLVPQYGLILVCLALLTGLIAGSYPAFFLSSIQTIRVLQGNLKIGSKGAVFRKILVVIQFTISVGLIIGTAVIFKQLDYFKSRDIGYAREQVVSVSLKGETRTHYQRLKDAFLRERNILGVSGSVANMPYFGWSSGTADWEGKDPGREVLTFNNIVDYDFVETLKIKMVGGRSFSREFPGDVGTAFLINEKMAEIMESQSPVGERLSYWRKPGRIIGVMKNFNFLPLENRIEPLVLMLDPRRVSTMLIRLSAGKITSSLKRIRNIWSQMVPGYPFTYTFLDDDFNNRYRGMERISKLVTAFAIIAILIACMGLFGLASFMTGQRSKEIGIRKVLGASIPGIAVLLSKEFVRCVLVANLVAWPVAYMAMKAWLENFAFRIRMDIGIFILAGMISLVIALLTVSYRSIRAAASNPIDELHYE
jgi:putative ABC transport system permease protein